ncbi:MAG: thioredoxin family protein [Traorella sp.]
MKELMKSLKNEEQFYELIKENKKHVFVFSASWCPDCVFIQPFMPQIISKYKDFEFIYVDRDQYIDLCIDLEVLGIPSFIVYENGKEKGRFVSKFRKSQQEIEEFLGELK